MGMAQILTVFGLIFFFSLLVVAEIFSHIRLNLFDYCSFWLSGIGATVHVWGSKICSLGQRKLLC